jgi:hypothetical protein
MKNIVIAFIALLFFILIVYYVGTTSDILSFAAAGKRVAYFLTARNKNGEYVQITPNDAGGAGGFSGGSGGNYSYVQPSIQPLPHTISTVLSNSLNGWKTAIDDLNASLGTISKGNL